LEGGVEGTQCVPSQVSPVPQGWLSEQLDSHAEFEHLPPVPHCASLVQPLPSPLSAQIPFTQLSFAGQSFALAQAAPFGSHVPLLQM
jgi:hypothetical protein